MSEIMKSKQKFKIFRKPNTKKSTLDVNLKGFLCSCNFREKDCIRESYNLLNKYYNKLHSNDKPEESEIEDDIQNSLSKEISSLKDEKHKFQVLESGAKNFLFIRTTIKNPVELAHEIVKDIHESKSQQTRYLIRLVPIEITCKAYIEDIVNAFGALAEKHFKENATTFSVIYNHRNNNSLNRDEVVKNLAEKVFSIRSDHKVNLKEPQLAVIVEVVKGIALLSVVPDYFKYKKYNLLVVSEEEKISSSGKSSTEDA